MILRAPRIEDYVFVYECYADWPLTDKGPMTLQRAVDCTRRWIARDDEICLIAEEDGERVGLTFYRRGRARGIDMRWAVRVDELVVHPAHREQGHANAMMRELRDRLVADGVAVAIFDARPGPIADQVERGKFNRIGEVQGQTGPLVRGQLTADMEV